MRNWRSKSCWFRDREARPGHFEDLVDTYRQYILGKKRLKKPQQAKQRVVIIGAGIAGLLAGRLLKAAGFRVTILEANPSRVGGRIRTFGSPVEKEKHFKCEHLYAEAGAMRIPEHHTLVNTLIDVLKLRKEAFHNQDVDIRKTGSKPRNETESERREQREAVKRTWLYLNSCSTPVQRRQLGEHEDVVAKLGFSDLDERSRDLSPQRLLDNILRVWDRKVLVGSKSEQVEAWKDVLTKFGYMSIHDFLRTKAWHPSRRSEKDIWSESDPSDQARLSQVEIEYIGTFENLKSRLPLSFLHFFINRASLGKWNRKENRYEAGRFFEIPGGLWQLPYGLMEAKINARDDRGESAVAQLKNFVVKGARVLQVERHGDKFLIKTTNSPKFNRARATDAEPKNVFDSEYPADVVLITVPFSALRWVKFEPALDSKKRRAIDALHYDTATKVVLEFSKRFWEWSDVEWEKHMGSAPPRGHNSCGGHSISDLPNRFIYYPSHRTLQISNAGKASHAKVRAAIRDNKLCKGGVLLATYTWSDEAAKWDSIPADERLELALDGLVQVYGKAIKQFYTGRGATKSWMQSAFSGGEAAVFYPGQIIDLHQDIIRDDSGIYFAGEHASLKHAWIEGSLESAVRAALQISEDAAENAGGSEESSAARPRRISKGRRRKSASEKSPRRGR